jgi:hypothetical protein
LQEELMMARLTHAVAKLPQPVRAAAKGFWDGVGRGTEAAFGPSRHVERSGLVKDGWRERPAKVRVKEAVPPVVKTLGWAAAAGLAAHAGMDPQALPMGDWFFPDPATAHGPLRDSAIACAAAGGYLARMSLMIWGHSLSGAVRGALAGLGAGGDEGAVEA